MNDVAFMLRRADLALLIAAVAAPLACGSNGSSAASPDTEGDGAAGSGSGGDVVNGVDASGQGQDSGQTASEGGLPVTGGSSSGGVASSGGSGGGTAVEAGAAASYTAPQVGALLVAGSPGQVDITFSVMANQSVHAISPYVYGVNDAGQAASVGASIVRSGGNRLTAFNWENNASNAGADYMFENDDFMCTTTTCSPNDDAPGAFLAGFLGQCRSANAAALLTVPIVDYVAADKSPPGDVRNSGPNYLQTRFKQNKATKGSAFAFPPDTTDAYVYEDEMVNYVSQVASGVTIRWQLDNEPDLWSTSHAEVHPVPVTYAELAQRNIEYATAVKAVMPNAEVWGPVSYGWGGYTTLQGATDSSADGDFLSWWLKQMAGAGQSAGKRLIDGMDLHWYPEATDANGTRIIGNDTSASVVAAREQAPRSLWDSTYTETSWIAQDSTQGPIDLLPRLSGKIASNYPGTKLSFSEWNYGGGGDISGAIASADVLGIFGRDGVDMAEMWPSGDDAFTYAAFKAFRNYDGHGAAFGDTSVQATTSDVPDSSVYASLQSTDASHLVIVAINKATTTKVAGIVIGHPTSFTKAAVYTVTSGGGANLVPGTAISATATNAFRYSMPAQSVSVIVPSP